MRGNGLGQPGAGNAQFLIRIHLKSNEDVIWDRLDQECTVFHTNLDKSSEDVIWDSQEQEIYICLKNLFQKKTKGCDGTDGNRKYTILNQICTQK